MNSRKARIGAVLAAITIGFSWLVLLKGDITSLSVSAQTAASPAPAPQQFDQAAAIAKLREQIKGREQEPAGTVFKNVQMANYKTFPAARLLAVMEMGFSRSLGVNCTHCHVPEKWDSDEKAQKQIARDMSAMVAKINGESLKAIKNLKSATPTVNCTTCHRGQVTPALNLPRPTTP